MADGGTVGKAMAVLEQVADMGGPVRFGEVLAISDLPKATLYRLVQTLTQQSLLQFDADTQTYTLGMRLVRLAHVAWQQSALAPIARPFLDRLSGEVGETIHLAQLDNAQVLYVDKRNAAQPVEMFSDAGKVGPAYCTGVGKAMLAHLENSALTDTLDRQSFFRFTKDTLTNPADLRAELTAIRARGHAFDREEHEPGIICIAVPILGATGRILGAMSITGSTARTSLKGLENFAPRLKHTAEQIAQEAEAWRFPERNLQRRTGT